MSSFFIGWFSLSMLLIFEEQTLRLLCVYIFLSRSLSNFADRFIFVVYLFSKCFETNLKIIYFCQFSG
ncbi:uncharacterized protein Gasu_13010 [Galdieria sulphuraria]|uniref:Uncharacterized protein n=1 Tax=Galdieria sulphuraria TaxID=130081 RepID=M2XN59_GALSU|nr:uncharacterized protein Gasu_13010 [Galdieria sulphuraria]EME31632.1 hypothetical protein Gasu_13010 [Galdieria sulphuraria]|eukprot:XP_005708152.1 hypothetical protein Gasu_13010 [Galdieria sulphuraria]